MPKSSEYYDEEDGASYDEGDDGDYSTQPTSVSGGGGDDAGAFASQGERCMNRLHELHASTDWKKVLKHRKGAVVHVQRKGTAVYRGTLLIKGYSPAAVFAVVGTRKLWDEWYESGSLVENLNDTTSLTYMVMKGIVGSSTRDLCLVEKVEGSQAGAIFFCSTSVDSPKVPRVSGRVRAQIGLNGWVLEPVKGGGGPTSTNVSYYLQVNVKTFVPKVLTGKYLARRPVCISRIDDYLQKNGAPPLAGVDAAEQQPARSGARSTSGSSGGGAVAAGGLKRRSSRSSMRSGKSGAASSGFISAPSINEDHKSHADLTKARQVFDGLVDGQGFTTAQDQKGAIFQTKDGKGDGLVVKATVKIENVTTEQVLSTIISTPARRLWDERWMSQQLIEPINGHEHGIYLETIKGAFPHIENRYFVLAKGVEREEASSPNGGIYYLARSTAAGEAKSTPRGAVKGQLDVAGWHLDEDGDDSVAVEHAVQTDLKSDKLSPPLKKTAIVAIARAPRLLREFIDERGYAPFFVRWEEGPAHLDRDDGDLRDRRAEFWISAGATKAKAGPDGQRAWFQWSERMFDRGISLRLEPAGAAEVAKVQGLDRTVEFKWNESELKKGARLFVEAYDRGDGAEDVYIDGDLLDKTVQAAEVQDAAPVVKKKPKRAAADNGDAAKAAGAAAAGAAAGGAAAAGARSRTDSAPSKPVAAVLASDKGAVDQAVAKGKIPDDAMVILSPDLYFTRGQVAAVGGLLLVAIVLARVL